MNRKKKKEEEKKKKKLECHLPQILLSALRLNLNSTTALQGGLMQECFISYNMKSVLHEK